MYVYLFLYILYGSMLTISYSLFFVFSEHPHVFQHVYFSLHTQVAFFIFIHQTNVVAERKR